MLTVRCMESTSALHTTHTEALRRRSRVAILGTLGTVAAVPVGLFAALVVSIIFSAPCGLAVESALVMKLRLGLLAVALGVSGVPAITGRRIHRLGGRWEPWVVIAGVLLWLGAYVALTAHPTPFLCW